MMTWLVTALDATVVGTEVGHSSGLFHINMNPRRNCVWSMQGGQQEGPIHDQAVNASTTNCQTIG